MHCLCLFDCRGNLWWHNICSEFLTDQIKCLFKNYFFFVVALSPSSSPSGASVQSCSSSSTKNSNMSSGSLDGRLGDLQEEGMDIIAGSNNVLAGVNSSKGEGKGSNDGKTKTKEAIMHDKSGSKKHDRGGEAIV